MAGFIAFAPDALTPLGGYPGNDDEGKALQKQRDAGEMLEDFITAAEYLQQHPDCTGAVGAVGFCFGGEIVLQLAVRMPNLEASVSFYGRHPTPGDAARIEAPLMFHHASLDTRVNASWPDFEDALKAENRDYVGYMYDGANHGFHNDTTPRYDEAAAKLAWQRTIEHFSEHLNTDS